MKYILVLLMSFAFGQGGVSHGIYGESDTTLIGYTEFYGEIVEKTRYYFDAKDYNDASYVIQLQGFPFDGLNVIAQQEYLEKLKVIKKIEGIK